MYKHTAMTGAAAIALFTLTSAPANAVTYSVEFSGASWIDSNGDSQPYGGQFVVETASPITSAADFPTVSCALTGDGSVFLACGARQQFDPNGFNTGKNFIGVNLNNVDGSGGLTGFLWFDPGSFTTAGRHPIFTGVITDGVVYYGNFASDGTLTVSNVPEPATLLLMLAGLGGLAAAARRRG